MLFVHFSHEIPSWLRRDGSFSAKSWTPYGAVFISVVHQNNRQVFQLSLEHCFTTFHKDRSRKLVMHLVLRRNNHVVTLPANWETVGLHAATEVSSAKACTTNNSFSVIRISRILIKWKKVERKCQKGGKNHYLIMNQNISDTEIVHFLGNTEFTYHKRSPQVFFFELRTNRQVPINKKKKNGSLTTLTAINCQIWYTFDVLRRKLF